MFERFIDDYFQKFSSVLDRMPQLVVSNSSLILASETMLGSSRKLERKALIARILSLAGPARLPTSQSRVETFALHFIKRSFAFEPREAY
jgi:hypothetical protein